MVNLKHVTMIASKAPASMTKSEVWENGIMNGSPKRLN